MNETMQRELTSRLFQQRETGASLTQQGVPAYFESVKNGDVRRLEKMSADLPQEELSPDALRSVQYQFVISIAEVVRCCIAEGMEEETAYSLRSIYIRSADACVTAEAVHTLHHAALLDFAARMQQYSERNLYSQLVSQCMDYIYHNLHSKLTLAVLSAELGVSESHLSRTFHKETGVTLSAYTAKRRVQEAMNLLRYSDYSSLDIANYLCFSSHSHFISVFKAQTGMTPKEYRSRYTKGVTLSPM